MGDRQTKRTAVDEAAMQQAWTMFLVQGKPFTFRDVRQLIEDYEAARAIRQHETESLFTPEQKREVYLKAMDEFRKWGFGDDVRVMKVLELVEREAITLLRSPEQPQEESLPAALPHDVKIGSTVFRKGVKLDVLVGAAERWHQMASAASVNGIDLEAAKEALSPPAAQPDKAGVVERVKQYLQDQFEAYERHSSDTMARNVVAWCSAPYGPRTAQPDRGEVVEALRSAIAHLECPCRFDHHGYCQEHWSDNEGECGFQYLKNAYAALSALPPQRDDSGLVDELATALEYTLSLILNETSGFESGPTVTKARAVLAKHAAQAKARA